MNTLSAGGHSSRSTPPSKWNWRMGDKQVELAYGRRMGDKRSSARLDNLQREPSGGGVPLRFPQAGSRPIRRVSARSQEIPLDALHLGLQMDASSFFQ